MSQKFGFPVNVNIISHREVFGVSIYWFSYFKWGCHSWKKLTFLLLKIDFPTLNEDATVEKKSTRLSSLFQSKVHNANVFESFVLSISRTGRTLIMFSDVLNHIISLFAFKNFSVTISSFHVLMLNFLWWRSRKSAKLFS